VILISKIQLLDNQSLVSAPLCPRYDYGSNDVPEMPWLDPTIVPASSCFLSGPHCSPVVVYFDRRHPCFRNFNSTIPVDVIRVKSYVKSFLYPTSVPVRISINKLDLVPDRIEADLVSVFTRRKSGYGRVVYSCRVL